MSEKRKSVDVRILYALVAIVILGVLAAVVALGVNFYDRFGQPESRMAFDAMMAESPPTIYDYEGNVTDVDWLYENFGTGVDWQRVSTAEWQDKDFVYRLTEIRPQCDYAALKVCIYDENGAPLNGIAVVRDWPGAPSLPDFSSITKQWTTVGVHGPTEGEGCIAFGMGAGDYYYPDRGESGVSGVYPADSNGPGDYSSGHGMLAGTNHCHLDTNWVRVPLDEPTPPTPTPPPTSEPGDGETWEIDITIGGTIKKND